jgi:hypothetical protein
MLKQHKNALFDSITETGYNPKLFQAEGVKQPLKLSLKHIIIESFKLSAYKTPTKNDYPIDFSITLKGSPFIYSISTSSSDFNRFNVKYTLFEPNYPESRWSSYSINFDALKKSFKSWLMNHVGKFIKERDAIDLWAQLEAYKSFANESDITEESTSDFSEEEKENLRNSVKTFKSLVEESFNPNREQTEFINEQLDYLTNALERLNRFDWRGLAISTLLSIAVNLSVDTEGGRMLFRLFQQAFQSIRGVLQ